MSARMLLHGRLAGLWLALGGLIGCEGGGGGPRPETGGAGIPGVRGPVAPNMPKGGSKARPAAQGPAARRAAPAPAPAPKQAEGGTPPAAPQQ